MKHLKFLFPVIFPIFLLTACSGNNSAITTKNSDDSNSSATNSSGNEAHFSCIIDGQPVSGGAIDQMKIYNIGSINDVDEGKELLFYLSDTKSTSSLGVNTLRFSVPAKTGSSSFGHDENAWGIEVDIVINKEHTARYNSDSFTINITSLSASRVSGTFSGKFKLNGNITDTDKKEIEVSDGKFDLPMTKN